MRCDRKSILTAAAIALLALAGLAACGDRGADADGCPRGAVLILLDTVRADHLSCYGYGRETSPRISRLAAEGGVLFEQVVSFAPWTLPSVVNILSGCRPGEGVFEENRLERSLVEDLKGAGFATAAVTEGGFVSSFYGIDRGFDHFHEEEGPVQLHLPGQPLDPDYTGGIEKTFSLAREWIRENGDGKFFLFIHTYEPHAPYMRKTFAEGMDPGAVGEIFTLETVARLRAGDVTFDESDREYLEALYDGGILESDRHVGAFIDFLEEIGLGDEVLVVVTSDHGEELGDHYPSCSGSHGHSLRDDLVMVPLIIRNPRESYPVRRVGLQVRLMDVMPTIADALGVPLDESITGRSLVPLMRGKEGSPRAACGGEVRSGPERAFLRWLGYKYIRVTGPEPEDSPLDPPPPPMQLYDLTADPGERTNLARKEPDIVRSMMNILAGMEEAGSGGFSMPDDMDATLRRRLESLGY